MGCTLITTSSKPRLSSAFRFKRRQGATGAGNSPSVSEGVAEGRGSNMSVKIPCAWLAARGDALSLLRSQRVARCARAERLAVRAFYVTQKSRKSQKITRCASKWARFASWRCGSRRRSPRLLLSQGIWGNCFFCDKDIKFQLLVCQIFILFLDNFG